MDIVILDLVMPDLNGKETFDLLRAIDKNVLVLLSRGYSVDGDATELLEKGCDGFIQKPFDLKDLSQRMRVLLDREQRTDGESRECH